MKKTAVSILVAVLLVLFFAASSFAEIILPSIIGDNMVIQRDKEIIVWGWANPGSRVTVSIGGNSETANTDESGAWRVRLPALNVAGPYSMSISSVSDNIELKNILAGEVWVCSGQSNMEMQVSRVINAEEEIAAADYPEIRLFLIPRSTAHIPQKDVNASWQVCSPETV